MKTLTLLLFLLIALPFLDACCRCTGPEYCDYDAIKLIVDHDSFYTGPLKFTLEMSTPAFSARQHSNLFGSGLMACSCPNAEPLYAIKQLQVFSYPSFFADEADSSDISDLIWNYLFYRSDPTDIVNSVPQFHYCGGGFLLLLKAEPFNPDTTYLFRFFLTKTNDAVITVESDRYSLDVSPD